MQKEIRVKIPWWYKIFIKGMPNFYDDIPKYEECSFVAGRSILSFSFVGARSDKQSRKTYKNSHEAYLKARWMAYWCDKFDFTDRGIGWYIKKINNYEKT